MSKKQWYWLTTGVAGLALALLALAFAWPGRAAAVNSQPEAPELVPVGNAFTYQGYLEDGGSPANGSYDLQFELYDAGAAGAQLGTTVNLDNVNVINGLFTAELDFGDGLFGGGGRWLEIGVRPGASGGAFTILTPRQELTPAPYALGMPNVYTNEALNFVGVGRNFPITGNEVFGVRYNGPANDYGGMYVETSHANGWPFYGYATNGSFRAWSYYNGTNGDWYLYNSGIRLSVPNEGGLRIASSTDAAYDSLVISNTVGSDGIQIYDTGDDGIQIGADPDYPNFGVYIPSPGVSNYGLWPNTAQAAGEWALFTADKIEAANVTLHSLTLVAQVTGETALTAGDVVAVSGAADPIPGTLQPLPLVSLASGVNAGVIGVVESRMVWEVAPGKEAEGEMSLHSAAGPAQPGDYVSLIVMGVTQVKVDPAATIAAGDRLVAADLPGLARALQTRQLEGMTVTEGAPAIGIALAAPTEGQATIPVFVTLR